MTDRADIPPIVQAKLDEMEASISRTESTFLGYLSKPVFADTAWYSVWVLDEGDALVLGAVALTGAVGAKRVMLAFVDVASELFDGTQVMTNSWDQMNQPESEKFRVRSYPATMSAEALVQIHRARLREMSSRVRPFDADLVAVIERDAESSKRSAGAVREQLRVGKDGRYRLPLKTFIREFPSNLPFVRLMMIGRRRARRARELKELGLGHLLTQKA